MLACSIEPHGHDVFGTHTLIGHARRRDQKPLAPTHRYVAGSALIYAEGVHLPARLDNRSADRDFIVSNHRALLSGTRGGRYSSIPGTARSGHPPRGCRAGQAAPCRPALVSEAAGRGPAAA